MKDISFILFFILTSLSARSQSTVEVTLIISDANVGGFVHVALCHGEESFRMDKGCALKTVEITDGRAVALFEGVGVGYHAVKAFHDVDMNGILTTNWFGIPVEPYGFSNDVRRVTGPPTYEMAHFQVKEGSNELSFQLR